MSTKKTDKETAQMPEKKGSPEDIQARMEAGKVEIMKAVEGVPGAEKLGELFRLQGMRNGGGLGRERCNQKAVYSVHNPLE